MTQFGLLHNLFEITWLTGIEHSSPESYSYELFLIKLGFYSAFSDSPFQINFFYKKQFHPLVSHTAKECKLISLTEGTTRDLPCRAPEGGKLLLK